MGAILYQKVIIFDILGARFPPLHWFSQADSRAHRPCQVESMQRVAPVGLGWKTWFSTYE